MSYFDDFELTSDQLAPLPWRFDGARFELIDAKDQVIVRFLGDMRSSGADIVAAGLIALYAEEVLTTDIITTAAAVIRMIEVAPLPWKSQFGRADDANGASVFSILMTRGDADPESAILRKIISDVNLFDGPLPPFMLSNHDDKLAERR